MVEESIYNLIPRQEKNVQHEQRHISKFRPMVKEEEVGPKQPARTMGPAKVKTEPPSEFLKKHSKEPQLAEKTKYVYECDKRKPAVPKSKEAPPLMGIKTMKNFITANAVDNIMAVPRKPATNVVDTRGGDAFPIEESGLVPKYRNKKDFGTTPEYIIRRAEEVRKAQEEYDAYVKEHMKRGAIKKLTEAEHHQITAGLKGKWEEAMQLYQCLPVVCDTLFRKHTKERLEGEMKTLERDIEMMEKHKTIYVA